LTGRELSYWLLDPPAPGFGLPFTEMAFTPDGKRLVAGGGKAGVRVFDTATGKRLDGYPGHLNGVPISVSADGQLVATMESPAVPTPKEICVWNLITGKKEEGLTKRLSNFSRALFSPDGRVLAAIARAAGTPAASSYRVTFLDLKSDKQLGEITIDGKWLPHLVFSPDGGLFAAAEDDRVRAWKVPDGKPAGDFTTGQKAICSAVLLDSDRIVTAGYDGTARVCQLSTGKELLRVTPVGDQMNFPCAVSPDRKTLTAGSVFLRHYELATGKERSEPISAGGPVAISSSGKLLAYGPPLDTDWLEPAITLTERESGKSQALTGHTKPVRSLGFTDKDATLVSGDEAGNARVWATKTGKELRTIDGRWQGSAFDVSPKRGCVAFATKERAIELIDASTGNGQASLRIQTDSSPHFEAGVTFSADGQFLAVAHLTRPGKSYRGGVSLWDLTTGKETANLKWNSRHSLRGIAGLSLSANGKALARADGRCLFVWDVAAGAERQWAEADCGFNAVAFAPDGKSLAVGDGNGLITLWDVKTAKVIGKFEGHRAPVAGLAWTPDGTVLASSSADGSVLLWDATGKAPAPAKPKPPTPAQRKAALDKAWDDLAGPSVPAAYRAMLALATDPKEGLALLRERLKPPAAPAAGDIAALIAGLDDDAKAKADRAERALAAYGEAVRGALQRAPANKPSAEARRRIERLLAGLDDPAQCPEALRVLRAVEVLEYLGTPDAVALLHALAGEAVRKPEKADAARALQRLQKRKATAK
jgi:WD40 repeat protein